MKKLLIGVAVAVAVIATSVGTTVATAHFAPEMLPQGKQGEQGPVGPRGTQGPIGVAGHDGEDGEDAISSFADAEPAEVEDECRSFAGGTGVCTEGPEYEEMCRQLHEEMEAGRIATGGFTDEGSAALDRYSRNSCDQR
jgi:hypothetical protein